MKIIINVYNKREGKKVEKAPNKRLFLPSKGMNSYKQTEKRISVKMADF